MRKIQHKRGISLIEIGLGLGLVALISVGIMRVIEDQNQAQKAVNSAILIGTVRNASQDYMRTYNQQLLALSPVGGAAIAIRVGRTNAADGPPPGPNSNLPSVQGSGLLPANFIDRDAFRFSHMLLVRQPVAGQLEGLVIQSDAPGATAIRDGELGRMVSRLGPSGGFIPRAALNGAPTTRVQGNGGSWATDAGLWASSGFQPLPGRVAATVSFGNASMLSDYLNRYDVGIPEANTMRANLTMGNNNISGAKDITGQTLTTTGVIQAGTGGAYDPANFPGLSMYMQNGGIACAGNADGCKFWISDDGGFTDNNDGWIRFQGMSANKGLAIEGAGNNLSVAGGISSVGNIKTDGSLWIGMDSYTAGNAQIVKSLEVGENIKGGGNLDMGEGGRFGGALYVRGTTALDGGLNVNGNTTLNGDTTVIGNHTVYGTIENSGDVLSNGTVYGNTQLATSGRVIAVGDIGTTDGNIEVANGRITAKGNIASNSNITAVGISAVGPLYGNTIDGNYIRQGGILLDDIVNQRALYIYRYCKANPGDADCN